MWGFKLNVDFDNVVKTVHQYLIFTELAEQTFMFSWETFQTAYPLQTSFKIHPFWFDFSLYGP